MNKILLITECILLVVCIALFCLYQNEQTTIHAKSSTLSVEEQISLIPADKLSEQSVKIEPITTNLKDGHYIILGLSVLTDHPDTAIELEGRMFQLKDFLFKRLSDSTLSDVETKESIQLLLNELKDYLNEELSHGEILKIYITDKIIP